MKTTAALLIIVLGTSATALAQNEDTCRDVLVYSARNNTIENYDLAVASRVYDQYCEDGSVRSGTNFNLGLDAVIKTVPLKFNIGSGSTEERTKNFRKTFQSESRTNQNYYKSISQVSQGTTDAWLECKRLSGQGIIVRPQIGATQAIIEIKRAGDLTAIVNGVTYDSSLLSCKAPGAGAAEGAVAVNENTKRTLANSYWSITCTRTPQHPSSGEAFYPRAEISVSTTRGAFLMPIPPEAVFSNPLASDLQKQIDTLVKATNTTKVAQGTAECVTATGTGLQICWDVQDLPEKAAGNNPHTRDFKFTFARPFQAPPTVVPGINTKSSGNAPAVYGFEIRTDGYEGVVNNMLTSGATQDGTVRMSYVAIGVPAP